MAPPPVTVLDGPPDPATAARVRALAGAAAAHDGVAPLGEQTLLDLVDPDAPAARLLGVAAGGDVVGYAHVDLRGRPASAELVVAPGARGAGHGAALLDAARSAADAAGAGPVRVWAHGDLPAARALAARAGLTVRRELWVMARGLEDVRGDVVPDLPPGVTLRAYRTGADDDAVLAVNARAFAWHPEQGRLDAAGLAARRAEPWFRADDLLLAERDGRLVAFCWLKVADPEEGELYVLGVDPDAQGSGLGRTLTAVTLQRLAARGLRRAVLYTEADNHAAVATYRRAGFEVAASHVQYG